MASAVASPRRVLAVALEKDEQHLSRVINDLTGSAPEPQAASLAGTSHDLALKTPYYSATVPIWLDLVASPAEWADSFLSDEASEVLSVLGGLFLVFAVPPPPAPSSLLPPASSSSPSSSSSLTSPLPTADATAPSDVAQPEAAAVNASSSALQKPRDPSEHTRNLIRHVGRVVKSGLGGWEWDGVGLAVGVGPAADIEEWDELCAEAGLEFVHVNGRSQERNEYGEKTGIPRMLEALEANDWAQLDAAAALSDFDEFQDPASDDDNGHATRGVGSNDLGDELDPENLDFGFDRADFEGLKRAIWRAGDAEDHGAEDKEAQRMEGGLTTSIGSTAINPDGPQPKSNDTPDTPQGADLEDQDVLKMEQMMRKLQAVREVGEGMPEEQRRRMAARAVQEVMKDL